MTPRSDPAPGPLPGLPQPGTGSRFLRKAAAAVAGAVFVVLGLAFSVVFLAIATVAGLGVWGYVAWRTRALRRDRREGLRDGTAAGGRGSLDARGGSGEVIEGEAVKVAD